MREVKLKYTVHDSIMQMIATHYQELRFICQCAWTAKTRAKTFDDIFQDTVLYVVQDAEALGKEGDEMSKHFLFRFRMLQYQAAMEQFDESNYAYNQETTQEEADI